MGEYIRNRQLMDGSERTEIKIGVATRDISDWSLNFPLIMLKEFDFLGFEDYYGGWNDSHFLRQAIANYEKTATFNWVKERRFSQFSKDQLESFFLEHPLLDESGKEIDWMEELVSNFNIFLMSHPTEDVFVVSDYYVKELFEWLKNVGFTQFYQFKIAPYEYQHLK